MADTAQQPRYVALGDSTGVGVGAHDGRGYAVRLYERLRAQVPSLTFLNLCESGSTAAMLVRYQLPRALRANASLATVFIGTNDLLWGDVASFQTATQRVAEALHEAGTRTLFCTLPNLLHAPIASTPLVAAQQKQLESKVRQFNEHLRRVAQRDGHALLDLYGVGLADFPHFFSSDGFHPSADGYEELANRLYETVQRLELPLLR